MRQIHNEINARDLKVGHKITSAGGSQPITGIKGGEYPGMMRVSTEGGTHYVAEGDKVAGSLKGGTPQMNAALPKSLMANQGQKMPAPLMPTVGGMSEEMGETVKDTEPDE